MEIEKWITENLKKKSNCIIYPAVALWLIVFVGIFFNFLNLIGFNPWLKNKFSDYIYQDIKNEKVTLADQKQKSKNSNK